MMAVNLQDNEFPSENGISFGGQMGCVQLISKSSAHGDHGFRLDGDEFAVVRDMRAHRTYRIDEGGTVMKLQAVNVYRKHPEWAMQIPGRHAVRRCGFPTVDQHRPQKMYKII